MANFFSDRIITSIDVGTTKICVLVANQLDSDHIEILGVGKAPSDGLRKGVVIDMARTINSIKTAVNEAEMMSGHNVESAYIGISGGHIQSINSSGVVPIKSGEVRLSDIENVMAAAKAVLIPEGQQILHVLPQYFIIDGRDKLHDPVGMHGVRLEVQSHIIIGATTSVQNLIKCCESAGIKVRDIILEQLASATAVLSDDEKQLGVGVLDIGGGTTDVALYQNGSIRHTMVLPVAGNHFTNDIAVGLRITLIDAERIKKINGLAYGKLLQKDELIEVEEVQGCSKRIEHTAKLVSIIEPRAYELLSLINEEIIDKHLQPFVTSGFVLTGGSSLLKGIKELAEEIFRRPVRVGPPRLQFGISESLDSPIYATGYGILLYVLKNKKTPLSVLEGPMVKRIFGRMKSWVADFF